MKHRMRQYIDWPGLPSVMVLMIAISIAGCDRQAVEPSPKPPEVGGGPTSNLASAWSARAAEPGEIYTDVTADVGLDFVHQSGHGDRFLLPEIQGGGAAVFDYDNDGHLDIYLVNAGNGPPDQLHADTASNRLYRQNAVGVFSDVTASSGLGDRGYGMGCAVADIDNDGDVDVYVTNLAADKLYRNNGDGTFTDISIAAGIDNDKWSASAAFLDFDRDGFLDLFVTNYVVFNPEAVCGDKAGRPDFCGPQAFIKESDVLYRNVDGMRFENVAAASNIASTRYAGLGVVCADFNDDGWIDIYVANDADPNNLWINQQDGTFVDEAILLGAAFDQHGIPEAGMGVGTGDADFDGDLDIFLTHLIGETNTFYRNLGELGFDDATVEAGLALPSLNYTGFGTALFDYDNDGDLDIVVANGAVKRRDHPLSSAPTYLRDYVEPNQLFSNDGSGRFEDASAQAGAFGRQLGMSRGLIPADFDHDGDQDLLVVNIDGPARLYRNNDLGANSWIEIRAVLGEHQRDAIGAKILVVTAERTYVRHAVPPGAYLTGAGTTIHIGLGAAERVERIEVRWPNGLWERFPPAPIRSAVTLRQGKGDALDGSHAER